MKYKNTINKKNAKLKWQFTIIKINNHHTHDNKL